ncbi:MAG: hypothetical protein KatS3mg102_1050 [Planctomycetota bacterium]|nr:MAG: hypothetical protein KatS3mg102_1050 [Planctomycetota bacterium]
MSDTWSGIEPRRAQCAACGQRLDGPGVVAYAALWRQGAMLRRRDLCEPCFRALPERPPFYWRCAGRAREGGTRRRAREQELVALQELFTRLGEPPPGEPAGPLPAAGAAGAPGAGERAVPAGQDAAERASLRYLLGLELVRRRRLELVELGRQAGADCLVVRASGRAELIVLPAPPLDPQALARLGQELERELGLGADDGERPC